MRSHIDGLLGYLAIGEENVAATVGAANRVADKVEGLNFSGYGSELNGSRGWRSRCSRWGIAMCGPTARHV